jgi:hydroxymethylpyrimidine kinase/phosphomethylpyrimidine kinase
MGPYRAGRSTRGESAPVLLVSGLDPSGGAGFLADARVATLLGCRAVGAVTALTDQNSLAVVAANPVDPQVVGELLSTLLSDVEVAAVKIGMIGHAATARAVGEALQLTAAPVVWDPVVAPTRGDVRLLDGDAREALDALIPHLTILTPNAEEASLLSGLPVHDEEGAVVAAERLRALGVPAVLVKGGHLTGDQAVDLLVTPEGTAALRGPRVRLDQPVHGTGCALSTAIACHLAMGHDLRAACSAGKDFVAERLRIPVRSGRGRPSIV